MKRKKSPLAVFLSISMAAGLVLSGITSSEAKADTSYNLSPKDNDRDWMTYEELGQNLEQIEKESDGKVKLGTIGKSRQGREIYSARVGTGDKVLLVEGNIHGNEKSGPEALVQMLEELGTSDSDRAKAVRKGITIVAVPRLNVDGAEIPQRQNIFPWDDVVKTYPHLEGAKPAWNYSESNKGFDINRDFNPDLNYEPKKADLPGSQADPGFYLTPESRSVRDLFLKLQDEFGEVGAFVDLHHMGTPKLNTTGEDVTASIDYPALGPDNNPKYADWPNLDQDESRRYALAAALGMKEFSKHDEETGIARYIHPEKRDYPGQARDSFALNGVPTVLFEMPGQQPQYGYDQELVDRVENGLWGITTRMADGSVDDLNGDDFFRLPKYWVSSASDMNTLVERFEKDGAFKDDKAVHSLKMHLTAIGHYEKEGKTEKVIKHMNGFKSLLDQQKEKGLISEEAYKRLKSGADELIEWA